MNKFIIRHEKDNCETKYVAQILQGDFYKYVLDGRKKVAAVFRNDISGNLEGHIAATTIFSTYGGKCYVDEVFE